MKYPDTDALYENAACGLLLTHSDGTIIVVNSTFCKWIGYEKIDLIQKRKLQDLLTVGSRIFHQTHWSPLLKMQGSIAEIKFDMKHCSGESIPVLMNAVARDFGEGILHEISVSVAEDRNKYEREILKARKRAEELLRTAEQMMGIVSHDLRNPLNTILLGTQLLKRESLTPSQQQSVARIARSGERANRLISDMLDLTTTRLGSGLKLSVKPTDAKKFISDSVEELSAAFPGRVLTGNCDIDLMFNFDADRLFQVIGNLVSNAYVYGSADSPISIIAEQKEERFLISVHNFGIPIDASILPSLFLPMTRGTETGGELRSVGLGLFIVREIAKAHGGDSYVTSSALEGTKFTVEIPIHT